MHEHDLPEAPIVERVPGPRGTPEPWTYDDESARPPLPPIGWPWMPPPAHLRAP